MDQREAYNKICNTVKTDLSLLLECLKCQMKCPELQKQALLTIHSICENREDNVDLLREMGGAAFVYNLSKSSIVHAEVKETALFTLGTIAEANVYCKNSLCRKETFADLAGLLTKEDNPLTHKRVSLYLLSVLVANNKPGQTLAQTTGCLDILLDLFRTTFPLSTEATLKAANATQNYQLWASVSSALCGCVNNPQNEEGQRVCVAAFPIIKIWLEEINLTDTEIFQPICSFIAMTVANNSCVQESFSASGCLDTLSRALVRLASAADTSLLSCQLSVILAKTLSSCISDNSSLAAGLAQYGVVSHLFSLLASPHLDPEDRLSILLTLGHCTEASEEHQFQLVQCGGLPLVITLLTEDASEEVKKTATFILQTCKQATMSLGVPGLIARKGEGENEQPVVNIEAFKSSARELLRRIDLLEKRQDAEDEQENSEPSTSTEGPGQPSLPPALPVQQKESIKTIPTAHRQTSTLKHEEAKGGDNNMKLQTVSNVINNEDDRHLKTMSSSVSMLEVKTKTSVGVVRCPVCKCTRSLKSSHLQPIEGGRERHTMDNLLFKSPAPVWHSVPKEIKCTNEEELQDREMSKVGKIRVEERSLSLIRCPGCVLSFEEMTSRNFESLQSSCHHSCDLHKALLEATEQFRRDYLNNTVGQADPDSESVSAAEPQRSWKNRTEVSLTPIRKQAGKGNSSKPDHQRKMYNGFSLTPLHRGARNTSYNKTGPSLTPLKRSRSPEERRGGNNSGHRALDEPTTSRDHCPTRRKRKDFSREEVRYLLCGVQTYGFSWNSILWSYPFQPGRTNVDLAKKYRQLMKVKAQDAGCA